MSAQAPVPSGRVPNVQSIIQHAVHLESRNYDEYYLKNANDPRLRNDPRLHEVLARTFNMQLNKELEQARSEISESKMEIKNLRQTQSEQLNALTDYGNRESQLKEENFQLRSDNQALNKTLIDMTINKTGDISTSEFNQLQTMHIERSQIRWLKDEIKATHEQAENANKKMKQMEELYNLSEQESKQKLALKHAELEDAFLKIEEFEETIEKNMDLNKTIIMEMAELEACKDEYEEKLRTYKKQETLNELDSQSRKRDYLRNTVKFQREYKTIRDKEQKTAKALAALMRQLEKEKRGRAKVTNDFNHASRMFKEEHDKNINLTRISEQQEAKKLDLIAENWDLQRELAESRQENQRLKKKGKTLSCFGRFFKI